MTLAAFLDALEQTPRDWRLAPGGLIRRGQQASFDGFGWCPLEAVDDGVAWNEAFGPRVMRAADNRAHQDPALRAQLLQRTGLAAPEPTR